MGSGSSRNRMVDSGLDMTQERDSVMALFHKMLGIS
jgi:hypothetical protein